LRGHGRGGRGRGARRGLVAHAKQFDETPIVNVAGHLEVGDAVAEAPVLAILVQANRN